MNLNSKLNSKIQNLKFLFEKLNVLKDLLLNMNNVKQQIEVNNKQIEDKVNEKNNLHKSSGVCPLCGSVIGETKWNY